MKAKNGDNSDMRRTMQYDRGLKEKLFPLALIVIISFCFIAIANTPCVAQTPSPEPTPGPTPESTPEPTPSPSITPPISYFNSPGALLGLIVIVALAIVVPILVVVLVFRKNKCEYALGLPKHSVRALLAFSLIVLIAIMLILFVTVSGIVTALLAILASIVAFYYAQRSTETEPTPGTPVEIEPTHGETEPTPEKESTQK